MPRVTAPQRRPAFNPKRNIVPDRLDLRDRPYVPVLHEPPPPAMGPQLELPVLDQGKTNACTGFALASVVNFLLRRHRDPKTPPMSPFMLYSMARRYDEFPGAAEDSGSSLRGAMKGWYKHGVCRLDLWDRPDMPPPAAKPEDDWWLDAARRPLGAYYRVDTRSVTDMHVALHDVGVLYASALCHGGWLRGRRVGGGQEYWTIPPMEAASDDGGHAFVILGYTSAGFIIQSSWGAGWGTGGRAILTYQDWTDNAMDCWVTQLGVATDQHVEIARSPSLRMSRGKVQLAADGTLRDREISPFVIDMENNGRLSGSGVFRTQRSDVEALTNFHIGEARKKWGLKSAEPTDIAIYAHGGLTGEETAAETAARWIPALYEARIFPIFLMWETDLWSTLKNRLADLVKGQPRPTGGFVDQLKRFWNRRLERLLAPAGSLIWGEMKQNADSITGYAESGGRILYESGMKSPWFTTTPRRLHLIGHSAGSIVHCYVVDRLARLGWKFDSVSFMAAAVTVDLFERTLWPRLQDKTVREFRSFLLTDAAEEQDPTCRPVLGYGRSLLYLVSESFEGGTRTPILGMQKYFTDQVASRGLASVKVWTSPGPVTASTTHGGFDDDRLTMESVIKLIRREKGLSEEEEDRSSSSSKRR
jgi:hypothetical protein